MASFDIERELQDFVKEIATKNTYHGNKIPDAIMKLIEVEIRENGAGVLAPYWLGVLQRGRGPRRSNKDSGLVRRIFAWMQKRNMFTSDTPEGKMNEARRLTWYINKYGNQQFRNKVFVDVYEQARENLIRKVQAKYVIQIDQITKEIL